MTLPIRIILGASILLALCACETTNEDQWNGSGIKPFEQAEQTCEDLMNSIREEEERDEFFVACMGTLGWVPRTARPVDL